MMMEREPLDGLREQIDAIDDQLLELMRKRFNLSRRILLEEHRMGVPADGGFTVLENAALVGTVPAQGTRIFVVESNRRLEQDVYEAEIAFLPTYQELHDAKKAKTAYYEKNDKASGGMVVAGAGGRKGNTIVWERVWSEKGGKYAMTVKTIGEGGAVMARVNGAVGVGTPKEGGFVEFIVTLRPGFNEVCLFNDFEMLPTIDAMALEWKGQ